MGGDGKLTGKIRIFCAVSGIGLLAGCSSGGGGPATFDEMIATADALDAAVARLDYTDPATLQASGNVTYEGIAAAFVADDFIAGEIALTAGFSSNTISGRIDNLTSEVQGQYAGVITIDNGEIDRTIDPEVDYTFFADVGGEIQSPGGDDLVVDGVLYGDFFGNGYSHVAGFMEGSITGPGGEDFFDGGFVADR